MSARVPLRLVRFGSRLDIHTTHPLTSHVFAREGIRVALEHIQGVADEA